MAIREHDNCKHAKVVRFLYAVSSGGIFDAIETWIAVPRLDIEDQGFLFSGSNPSTEKLQVEDMVRGRCNVLTQGQRFADWFTLRQFRVTGTLSGNILLQDASLMGYPTKTTVSENNPAKILSVLTASWFSSARSTEPMMRGTANEKAVLRALQRKNFISAVFECGM